MPNQLTDPIFKKTIIVSSDVIDENGHVNNVVFVQWMQDIALEHYSALNGVQAQGPDATWVIREHRIEYLFPAFENEVIEVQTWVANIRRVRSLRRYQFIRKNDSKLLARGETDWVFIDIKTGAPRALPASIANILPLLPDKTP